VSHNHVDSSANSALKAIASLTLSIATMVPPPCLSFDLPAHLGSTLVKNHADQWLLWFQIRYSELSFAR